MGSGTAPTMGGELCPAHGPAGSAWSPLAHHALFAQPSTGLFFTRSRFHGLGGWFFPLSPSFFYFFLRCQPSHGSRRGGKPIRHIINERRASAQLLGQYPCWLHSKVQAKLSNDLTAVSDPNTAPAMLPTLVFGG